MDSQGFFEIDHTGDLALRVWAEDFQGLLVQAARGLYHLLNVSTIDDSAVKHSFSIVLDDREAMLVDFLNELLYLAQDEQICFHTFSFEDQSNQLIVAGQGSQNAGIGRYIKAVTFHDLEITKNQSGLETIVTFDV